MSLGHSGTVSNGWKEFGVWAPLAGQAIQTNTVNGISARGSFNTVASASFKPFCSLVCFKNIKSKADWGSTPFPWTNGHISHNTRFHQTLAQKTLPDLSHAHFPTHAGLKPAGFSHWCSFGERQEWVSASPFACFSTLCFQPLHLLFVLLHSISYPGINHGLCKNTVLWCISCSLEGRKGRRDKLVMAIPRISEDLRLVSLSCYLLHACLPPTLPSTTSSLVLSQWWYPEQPGISPSERFFLMQLYQGLKYINCPSTQKHSQLH